MDKSLRAFIIQVTNVWLEAVLYWLHALTVAPEDTGKWPPAVSKLVKADKYCVGAGIWM